MSASDEGRLGVDGPAAIYPDGRRIWFVEGEKVREERSARQPSLVKAR